MRPEIVGGSALFRPQMGFDEVAAKFRKLAATLEPHPAESKLHDSRARRFVVKLQWEVVELNNFME